MITHALGVALGIGIWVALYFSWRIYDRMVTRYRRKRR
jgi:hypothetical protein